MNGRGGRLADGWRRLRGDTPLWVLTFGHFVTHWYHGMFYLLLVYLAEDLGLSLAEVGLLITVKIWTGTVTNLPGGMVVDLVGRKGLIMGVALAWIGIPYALMGFVSSYYLLFLCVILMGISNPLWHPAAMSTISTLYPARRGFGLSMHALGANAGDALAPLAAGVLLLVLSWREIVWLNALPGLVAAIFVWSYFRAADADNVSRRREASQSGATGVAHYMAGLKGIVGNGPLLAVLAVAGFRTLAQQGVLSFLPFYLAHQLGYSAALAGLFLALYQTGGFVASPVLGWLSDRVGRVSVARGGLIGAALLLFVLAGVRVEMLFVPLIFLLGVTIYGVRPVLQAWTLDRVPRDVEGTAISFLFLSQSLFSGMAPLLGGFIADRYGLTATFYVVAGITAVGGVVASLVPKEAERSRAATGEMGAR